MSDEGTQVRVREQEAIVSPFGVPGKNDKKHADRGTEEHKKQDSEPVRPKFQPTVEMAYGRRIIRQDSVSRGRSAEL